MKFLRWKSSSPVDPVEQTSSWRSRFNPFNRSNSRAQSPIESVVPVEPDEVDHNPFSLIKTPSVLSDEAISPAWSLNSRPPSTLSNISPSSSFGPSFPPPLQRQDSVYSHRSLRIQRDRSRPPSAIHSAARMDRPLSPQISENDCLVLTSTSIYPTGVAAELYVPEDCSYEAVRKQNREKKRHEFKDRINRNGSLLRQHSGIKSQEERRRIKRMSVNF